MKYIIGIDIGTTNIKVIFFDDAGHIAAEMGTPSPTGIDGDGKTVYDPLKIWRTVCVLLKHNSNVITAEYGSQALQQICGIAVTGMGEAGVPLDAEGNELYPIIPWYDTRTLPYVDLWRESLGDDRLFAITGLKNQHIFTANKLRWLKDQEPEVFAKMRRWHCVPDYIGYKLTNCSAIDRSLASRTMLLNMSKGQWSESMLKAAGLSVDIMPPIVRSGTRIGELTSHASEQCGIPAGTPVFSGGHDHICGALADGIFGAGQVLDSSGTAEEVLVSTDLSEDIFRLGRKGFNVGYHVASNHYYIAGGIPASGASVDWFHREFSPLEAGGSLPGANGILFLPHLRGSSSPSRDQISRGAFLGVSAAASKSDFLQAVYEGICFEARHLMEQILENKAPKRIVSIGGGTKNKAWLQVKADVFGLPVEVPEIRESTAFGAALLAGIGAGLYHDEQDAFSRTYRVGLRVEPNLAAHSVYKNTYPIFRELYESLLPLNEKLKENR